MENKTITEEWFKDEPILILRYAKQTNNWLSRKIDFCRNMIGLAWEDNRFDLVENYRFTEDLFIRTRIYKNATQKEKKAIKISLETKAIKRLKFLWQNDYQNFIDTLYIEPTEIFDKYTANGLLFNFSKVLKLWKSCSYVIINIKIYPVFSIQS
jgi:hypothetical protein